MAAKRPSKRLSERGPRTLAIAGLLIALNIILTRFFSIPLGGTFRVGFGVVPLHLAGYLLGPAWGFLVGAVADVLGVVLNSFGQMPHPGFTLTSGLHGFIPGLTVLVWSSYRRVRWGERTTVLPPLLISHLATTVLVSWLLQSVWLAQLFSQSYLLTLSIRALPTFVQSAIVGGVELLLLSSQFSSRLNRSASS